MQCSGGVYDEQGEGSTAGGDAGALINGTAQAVICNSGNANTCAPNGVEIAEKTCEITGSALGLAAEDIIVCSTGVIGQELSIKPFEYGVPKLAEKVSYNGGQEAAEAIMTTDTIPKSIAVEFEIDGKTCYIGGIAKGSGMIDPNMATMPFVYHNGCGCFSGDAGQGSLKQT